MTIKDLFGRGHTEFSGEWGPPPLAPYDDFVSIDAIGIIMMEIKISRVEGWEELRSKAGELLKSTTSWRTFIEAIEKDTSMSDVHKNQLKSSVASAMHVVGISIPKQELVPPAP